MIPQLRSLKLLDRIYLLWAICLLAHRKEHNLNCSPMSLENDYGKRIANTITTYWHMADDYHFIDFAHKQLTSKGLVVCENWQSISAKLYAI